MARRGSTARRAKGLTALDLGSTTHTFAEQTLLSSQNPSGKPADTLRTPSRFISSKEEGKLLRLTKNLMSLLESVPYPHLLPLSPAPYLYLFCLLSVVDGHLPQKQPSNPHQPWKWTLFSWDRAMIVSTQVVTGPPTFFFYPCQLIILPNTCELTLNPYGKKSFQLKDYYLCPSSNPGKSYCNSPGHFYCSHWGCETQATGWTPPTLDPHLSLTWSPPGCEPRRIIMHIGGADEVGGDCQQLKLTVLTPSDNAWIFGRTWGFRMVQSGNDPGGLFLIKKELVQVKADSVGPNLVLKPNLPWPLPPTQPPAPKLTSDPRLPEGRAKAPPPSLPQPTTPGLAPNLESPLMPLLNASYNSLNQTFPNMTSDCWLCLRIRPPYYDAIALNASFNRSSQDSPPKCHWDEWKNELTMDSVLGTGRCIGRMSATHSHLCTQISLPTSFKFLIPPLGALWLCTSSGLTPCVSFTNLQATGEMCLLVMVVPRVLYHTGEDMVRYWDPQNRPSPRTRREPVTAITLATLLDLASVGTGIASLTQHHQSLAALRAVVNEDLARIENSITHLEKSLSSLSEVVLQQGRGLDLLFLQQGGLCATLGEECCFYADHTGIVKESMAKLREDIARRRMEQEAQASWYEQLFQCSPWLTSLITTLLGPLVLLTLLLTFGPLILSRLVLASVKERIGSVQLMFLRQYYQTIPTPNTACANTNL